MSKFSEQMAQMMAAARPQIPTIRGGGSGGGAPSMSNVNINQTGQMTHGEIDAGAIMGLLGWKPKEYWNKAAEQAYEQGWSRMSPDIREQYVNHPKIQEMLQKAMEVGSPYVMQNNEGKYTFIPTHMAPAEAEAISRTGGRLTGDQMQAGLAGDLARDRSIEAQNLTRPKSEMELLSSKGVDVADMWTRAQNALIGGREAEAQVHRAQATIGIPAQAAAAGASAAASQAHAGLYKAQTTAISEGEKDQAKINAEEIKGSKQLFRDQYKQWQKDYDLVGSMPEQRRSKINQLGAMTIGHVSNLMQLSGKQPKHALGDVLTWTAQTGEVLNRDLQTERDGNTPFGTYGLKPDMEIAYRQMMQNAATMLLVLGPNVDPLTAKHLLGIIAFTGGRVQKIPRTVTGPDGRPVQQPSEVEELLLQAIDWSKAKKINPSGLYRALQTKPPRPRSFFGSVGKSLSGAEQPDGGGMP